MYDNSTMETGKRTLSVLLVVIVFLAVWQLMVMLFRPPEYLLPSPLSVVKELGTAPEWYLSHASRTIGATLLGFAVALLLGFAAAVGIVYSRILENTLYTLLVALNSIPKIALAPLFIIWLGHGIIIEGGRVFHDRRLRNSRRYGARPAVYRPRCTRSFQVSTCYAYSNSCQITISKRLAIPLCRHESGDIACSSRRDRR